MSHSPFLVWTDDLSVGFENLDSQHKTIFAMINRLFDAAEKDRHAGQSVPSILQNLLDYTHWHFAAEEAAMRKQGVSDPEFHRRHHAAMTVAIQDLVGSNWKSSGRFQKSIGRKTSLSQAPLAMEGIAGLHPYIEKWSCVF